MSSKSSRGKRKAASPPPASAQPKRSKAAKGSDTTATTAASDDAAPGSSAKAAASAPPQSTAKLDNTLAAFEGKFDVYSAGLPFIHKHYRPAGSAQPDYKATRDAILTYQAKPDFTMRLVLGGSDTGRLSCRTICNPFDDEPLEGVRIEAGKVAGAVKLDKGQAGEPVLFAQSGAGYEAEIECESEDCFDISGSGRFTLRHVWQGAGEDEALFEGSMVLKIKYGALMKRKGHGSGFTYRDQFWAVRALKDEDGEEIGIDVDGGDY